VNPLPPAVVANAIPNMPPGVAAFSTFQHNHWQGSYAVALGGALDVTLGIPGGNVFFPSAGDGANTLSAVHEILTSMRYLPAIRDVIAAEDAGEAIFEFLSSAAPAAIVHLSDALQSPAMEAKRWEFLELLGDVGTPDTLDVRLRHLQVALASADGGDRSAAASAIGAIDHPLAPSILAGQLACESNSIVKALLEAKLRVIHQNGSTVKTAA
jgi:hypothetical protein